MDLLLSKASPLKICLQIGLGTFNETRGVDTGIEGVMDEEQFDDASHGLKQLHALGYPPTFAWPCMAPPSLCKAFQLHTPPYSSLFMLTNLHYPFHISHVQSFYTIHNPLAYHYFFSTH